MVKLWLSLAFCCPLAAGPVFAQQTSPYLPPVAPNFQQPYSQSPPYQQFQQAPVQSFDQSDQPVLPHPEVVPDVPLVMPPPLPPRPVLLPALQPPSQASAMPPAPVFFKPPLAWRAKANALRNSSKASSISVESNYDDAIMMLVSNLAISGLRVGMLNSKAGELLAVPTNIQSRQSYVFTITEMTQGTVSIKGAPMQSSKSSEAQSVIDRVLQSINRYVNKRG